MLEVFFLTQRGKEAKGAKVRDTIILLTKKADLRFLNILVGD